jgi:hypothetical protein
VSEGPGYLGDWKKHVMNLGIRYKDMVTFRLVMRQYVIKKEFELGIDAIDCQYPADGVSLHTSLKSRQVVWRASTYFHVSYGSRRRLPAKVGSGATMYPMALDLASQLRWAPALPRAIWLRTSPLR